MSLEIDGNEYRTMENQTMRTPFVIARFTPALLVLGLACLASLVLCMFMATGAQAQTTEEMTIAEVNAIHDAIIAEAVSAETPTPDGLTPAVEDICTEWGFSGAVNGLCNAYCEAMDCDSDNPQANDEACNRVFDKIIAASIIAVSIAPIGVVPWRMSKMAGAPPPDNGSPRLRELVDGDAPQTLRRCAEERPGEVCPCPCISTRVIHS